MQVQPLYVGGTVNQYFWQRPASCMSHKTAAFAGTPARLLKMLLPPLLPAASAPGRRCAPSPFPKAASAAALSAYTRRKPTLCKPSSQAARSAFFVQSPVLNW